MKENIDFLIVMSINFQKESSFMPFLGVLPMHTRVHNTKLHRKKGAKSNVLEVQKSLIAGFQLDNSLGAFPA